jgi:hypothetical protein
MADGAPLTFADKFEQALQDAKQRDPQFGLRTLARTLAKDDPKQLEIVRRRLHKYRPKNGGGGAEVAPTETTRHEIEDAMGLDRDALAPDVDDLAAVSHADMIAALSPLRKLLERVPV